jgi:hypothetical protein
MNKEISKTTRLWLFWHIWESWYWCLCFGAQDSKFARSTPSGLVLCGPVFYWIATAVVLGILYMIFWRLGMVFSTYFSLVC